MDVMRGITVAAMIVVNNAGGDVSYAALRHSVWNGLTPCDLVFPFFLFIMGVSTYISLKKSEFKPSGPLLRKITRRAALLLIVGLCLNTLDLACGGDFDIPGHLRLTGVLQRIAVCYFLAALAALYIPHRRIPYLAAALLAAYAVLLLAGGGYAADGTGLLSRTDRLLLGEGHLYVKSPVDPEGIPGTVSSLAHTLLGFMAGAALFDKSKPLSERVACLFCAGFLSAAAGYVLSGVLPVNKRVWSPSYVLVSCGLAASALAALTCVTDIWGKRKWSRCFVFYGTNPLFLYVASEILSAVIVPAGLKARCYGVVVRLVPDFCAASLVYSLLFTLVFGLAGYVLYKKKIFIKL